MIRVCSAVIACVACGGSPAPPDARPAYLIAERALIDFGTNVSGTAVTDTLHVTNAGGTATDHLEAVAHDPPAFMVTASQCVDPLAPGASCDVDVEFHALGLGSGSGTLTVGSLSVLLEGDAIFDPGPSVSPPFYDFGALAVGSTMTTTITVSATGAPEGPISVSVTGDDYAIAADHCTGVTLGTCTVDVSFAPTIVFPRHARLDVDIPSPGRPIYAALFGVGQ